MSYDGQKLKLYHNGVVVAQSNTAQIGSFASSTIGSHGAVERFFSGSIDEVRLYDRALSDSEMLALYSGSIISTGGDCNDADGTLSPGTAEVCDGIDNDCDGQIDEGVQTTYYQDVDSDGFGNGTTTGTCSVPGTGRYTLSELIQTRNENYVPTSGLTLRLDA